MKLHRYINRILRPLLKISSLYIPLYTSMLILFYLIISSNNAMGFGLKDVYENLHVNNTKYGNYQDASAGYYSGGSSVIRTKKTAIQPFAMNLPSITSGCNGIDAFAGSFSMISGPELMAIGKNIGAQAPVYAFHLGLKTYAPQIEQTLKDLRNLQMQLNQFGIGHCKATQAAFAAVLPQNTATYETVCNEMASGSGYDLGDQRKKCKDYQKQKEAIDNAQKKDSELLIDNYNLFVAAANKAGIPQDLHQTLMSMIGTIVVKDGVMIPYPSLANDAHSWSAHINGGEGASLYSCNDAKCLIVTVKNNISISADESYTGKAKTRLNNLREKMQMQEEDFSEEDKRFLDSLGTSFPIFDHITLEAISKNSILDGSSQVVARYMLLTHLNSVTSDVRKGVISLKQKQINDKYLTEYEKTLQMVLEFGRNEWAAIMTDSDRINERAEKIEKHIMARERG